MRPPPAFVDVGVTVYLGDALEVVRGLPTSSIDAVVTSPPYVDARPEYPSPSPAQFGAILGELRRVVSGSLVVNVGRLFRDGREWLWWSDLITVAEFAGWPLRDTLVWIKPNANPIIGPVLANSHEYVFLFGEGFDTDGVRMDYAPDSLARLKRRWISSISTKGDNGDRNGPRREERRGERKEGNAAGARARSFVTVYVGREKGNPHPAPMPLDLAHYLVTLSGGRTILDPFAGSGTTLLAGRIQGREVVGIELDEAYVELIRRRLSGGWHGSELESEGQTSLFETSE